MFDYVCWVMVNKKDLVLLVFEVWVFELKVVLEVIDLSVFDDVLFGDYDEVVVGSLEYWGDYMVGEKIDYVDGIIVEEVEYMMVICFY